MLEIRNDIPWKDHDSCQGCSNLDVVIRSSSISMGRLDIDSGRCMCDLKRNEKNKRVSRTK